MKTFDMVTLRQKGLPISEIARRGGITPKEVEERLKGYDRLNRDYSCATYARAKHNNSHSGKHPEQKGGSA